ncbi:YeeE/YedE family protein [Halopseudomonas maritima]|uniref:YeeE/YedE family protein n=1 Tax=Halopseudomonas maritima TaxID=2918528 RepID=UPI001EEB19E2|nr:YeeE/YedE thiosulfate transporter family protein [Halopseudomonas maritima]UJJ33100.1 YeeE/YedE family protein [Halopseudomonas maritima]
MSIDWVAFTPLSALLGGALIGAAAALLMLFNGRIAGISGLVGRLLSAQTGNGEALLFVLGLLLAPWLYLALAGEISVQVDAGPVALVVAGLLVGFGSRLGSGCTSGHGVCGLSRLSLRSLVATLSFMGAGFAIVFFLRHLLGV